MEKDQYETQISESGHIFTFLSRGTREIIKLVRYDKMNIIYHNKSGIRIDSYNLGFGDKKEGSFEIDDKARSNNGDMYIVFNTVLHTIPIFFSKVGIAAIHVQGSDIVRHRAYHRFINQKFDRLLIEYDFFGSLSGVVSRYEKGTIYDYIVVLPKML